MARPPLILVSPNIEKKGDEFGDLSISLSETYQLALMRVGALPTALPATTSRYVIREMVARCDGVLLTGGEDIDPRIYENGSNLSPKLRKLVVLTPDGGARDYREMMLVDEVFQQRKPLLAICRGHQVLNVALGGTLIADIPAQLKTRINHRRMDKRCSKVHEVSLTPGSLIAKITGKRTLGVNSTHHQAVDRPADILTVVARSADGVVESLQLQPEAARRLPFLLSVQFHPERLADRHPEHHALFVALAKACAPKRR